MQKHILKTLLKSDFLFFNQQIASGPNKVKFLFPDLYKSNTDLKFLIKSLVYIKKQGGFLTVLISDPYIYELFSTFVLEAKLENKIVVVMSDQHIPIYTSAHTLLVLDHLLINERFCVRNARKNLNIITWLNLSMSSKSSTGIYKIRGNVENHEKLIFLFLIIKNCLN